MSIFVDKLTIEEKVIENPSLGDFSRLVEYLSSDTPCSFVMERVADRDAALDVDYENGVFALRGIEDSEERGNFGFTIINRNETSQVVDVGGTSCRRYSTVTSVKTVIAIARTYFETGHLDRSIDWHVAEEGLGVELDEIPENEILRANDMEDNLSKLLARI